MTAKKSTAQKKFKLGLLGGTGRMGLALQNLIATEFSHEFVLGAVVGKGDDLRSLISVDAIIDFSQPGGLQNLMKLLKRQKKWPRFTIGTTGLHRPEDRTTFALLKKNTLFVCSPNFSPGVLIMSEIIKNFSSLLKAADFKAEGISDIHHVHKKDSPSGTAKRLQDILRPVFGETPIESIREGEVVGEHSVYFCSPMEDLAISHQARDREVFARGALLATRALLLSSKKRGEINVLELLKGLK